MERKGGMSAKMRVAVVGAGISGMAAATELAKGGVEVVVYEKEEYLGGHARTVTVDGVDLDLGFMVFNRVTYPNMMEFFESLGVDMEVSDMSFAVSLDKGHGYEWGSRTGLSSLFAQKKNALNPYFWQMIREILKFKDHVLRYLEELESNPDIDRNETLGHFINSRGYSELFQKAYLVPVCASIWSCPAEGVMSFSAYSVLSFCRNHYLLQLFGRPQWLTVRWRSHDYVNKVREQLESRGCQIRTGCGVHSVSTIDDGCLVTCEDGSQETYNGCIMAIHAPDALKMLGKQATYDEMRILGAFQFVYSDVFLHRDKNLMPKNPAAWSAWNFLGTMDNKVCVTYWLNVLQNLGETGLPYLVTLNPSHTPKHTLLKWSTGHPFPSVAASKASFELDHIQGKRGIWFCGAYQGYGFHEDGLKAGLVAAHGMLGKSCAVLNNPKHMVPSLIETGARFFVTRFLGQYISTGCLILLEEGVHNPQFYWKVATNADLGLVDAYINGDFSVVDKNEGLQNLFMIFIANRDLKTSVSRFNNKRGWWTPLLFTACIASAKYFFQHVSRQNTVTQARRNISRHYDLSEDEDLKVARINKEHEVLEIGCGWGSLAIEVVKRTGCKYTGITLSEEQLRFAEMKVKEAGLQLWPNSILELLRVVNKPSLTPLLDEVMNSLEMARILAFGIDNHLAVEMIEAVGHEFMEGFFGCCDSVLAEDGILVLQDERYDEYRRSSDFIKEYIFPGGCLPSLSRITSAMVASSRLCVEHLENIGIHYHQTLRCWRENFLENQSKIIALGFNEKFIRTWEYYFDYCAAGFKTCTLGNYQVVFSRPGNVSTFGNAYKGVPSAY
ncbi:unnamed protein product [Camellia sinensis]